MKPARRKTFVDPRSKLVGRRTGVNIRATKTIHRTADGFEDFNDYLSESDMDNTWDVSKVLGDPEDWKENRSSIGVPPVRAGPGGSRTQSKLTHSTPVAPKQVSCKKNLSSQQPGPGPISSQNMNKNQRDRFAWFRNKNIGRRTGKNLRANKNIHVDENGLENFDDYLSESDFVPDDESILARSQSGVPGKGDSMRNVTHSVSYSQKHTDEGVSRKYLTTNNDCIDGGSLRQLEASATRKPQVSISRNDGSDRSKQTQSRIDITENQGGVAPVDQVDDENEDDDRIQSEESHGDLAASGSQSSEHDHSDEELAASGSQSSEHDHSDEELAASGSQSSEHDHSDEQIVDEEEGIEAAQTDVDAVGNSSGPVTRPRDGDDLNAADDDVYDVNVTECDQKIVQSSKKAIRNQSRSARVVNDYEEDEEQDGDFDANDGHLQQSRSIVRDEQNSRSLRQNVSATGETGDDEEEDDDDNDDDDEALPAGRDMSHIGSQPMLQNDYDKSNQTQNTIDVAGNRSGSITRLDIQATSAVSFNGTRKRLSYSKFEESAKSERPRKINRMEEANANVTTINSSGNQTKSAVNVSAKTVKKTVVKGKKCNTLKHAEENKDNDDEFLCLSSRSGTTRKDTSDSEDDISVVELESLKSFVKNKRTGQAKCDKQTRSKKKGSKKDSEGIDEHNTSADKQTVRKAANRKKKGCVKSGATMKKKTRNTKEMNKSEHSVSQSKDGGCAETDDVYDLNISDQNDEEGIHPNVSVKHLSHKKVDRKSTKDQSKRRKTDPSSLHAVPIKEGREIPNNLSERTPGRGSHTTVPTNFSSGVSFRSCRRSEILDGVHSGYVADMLVAEVAPTSCLSRPGSVRRKSGRRVTIRPEEENEQRIISDDECSQVKKSCRGRSRISSTGDYSGLPTPSCSPMHVFETTSSAPSKSQEIEDRLIMPPPATDGLRRSQRTRTKPIQWHKGERLIYDYDRLGHVTIIGVKPSNEVKYLQQEAEKRQRRKLMNHIRKAALEDKKSGRRVSLHAKLPADASHSNSQEITVYNTCSGEEDEIECLGLRDVSESVGPSHGKPVKDDPYEITTHIDQPILSVGNLTIKGLEEKPESLNSSLAVVYKVEEGAVVAKIHNTSVLLKTGDTFFVPLGNTYSIRNMRTDQAKLFYTVVNSLESVGAGESYFRSSTSMEESQDDSAT